MRDILSEFETHDPEHPDAWLSDEIGWTITVSEKGVVVWENLEEGGEPRYQDGVDREAALRLWILLTRGDYDEIERQPWKDGQGPPISDEELERRREDAAIITLRIEREFYDSLGPEDLNCRCRRDGCGRGTVRFSAFCRPHQFENVRKMPCPFDD